MVLIKMAEKRELFNTKEEKTRRMMTISDKEVWVEGIGKIIIHIPHFQAREIQEGSDDLAFFDTFLEQSRLGNYYGSYNVSEVKEIAEALLKWVDSKTPKQEHVVDDIKIPCEVWDNGPNAIIYYLNDVKKKENTITSDEMPALNLPVNTEPMPEDNVSCGLNEHSASANALQMNSTSDGKASIPRPALNTHDLTAWPKCYGNFKKLIDICPRNCDPKLIKYCKEETKKFDDWKARQRGIQR
jgi:hypothetical protein